MTSKPLSFEDIEQIVINDLNGYLLVNIFKDENDEVKIMHSDTVSIEIIRKD